MLGLKGRIMTNTIMLCKETVVTRRNESVYLKLMGKLMLKQCGGELTRLAWESADPLEEQK